MVKRRSEDLEKAFQRGISDRLGKDAEIIADDHLAYGSKVIAVKLPSGVITAYIGLYTKRSDKLQFWWEGDGPMNYLTSASLLDELSPAREITQDAAAIKKIDAWRDGSRSCGLNRQLSEGDIVEFAAPYLFDGREEKKFIYLSKKANVKQAEFARENGEVVNLNSWRRRAIVNVERVRGRARTNEMEGR